MNFPRLLTLILSGVFFGALVPPAAAQVQNGTWVYPSPTGNLLYQLDERGQRIADFSPCGYRGGTEPLPNVTALIPSARWVYVNSKGSVPLFQSQLRDRLMRADADGDGRVTKDEMRAARKRAGLPAE